MMTKQEAMGYQDDFLENVQETASDEIREAYRKIDDSFNEYLNAVQDDIFQQAFRYGYEKGFEAASRIKTA